MRRFPECGRPLLNMRDSVCPALKITCAAGCLAGKEKASREELARAHGFGAV
jgi:hypothetical protein